MSVCCKHRRGKHSLGIQLQHSQMAWVQVPGWTKCFLLPCPPVPEAGQQKERLARNWVFLLGIFSWKANFFMLSQAKYLNILPQVWVLFAPQQLEEMQKVEVCNFSVNLRLYIQKINSKGSVGDTNSNCCHSTHQPLRGYNNVWLAMWEMHLCSWSTGLGARKTSSLKQEPEMDCSCGFEQLPYTSLLFASSNKLRDEQFVEKEYTKPTAQQ